MDNSKILAGGMIFAAILLWGIILLYWAGLL